MLRAPGETVASLDGIKNHLLNIYSEEGMSGAERAEPLMEKTYVIEWRYLNSVPAPAIAMVKEEWPFLFSLRGIFTLLWSTRLIAWVNLVSVKHVKMQISLKTIKGTL